jgi:prenyltransferase beta subunit
MRSISEKQIKKIKEFIFKNGRLLERRLFSFFFENGKKDAVIKALVAYQNKDGGFGNGIEPDILCPDSTAIGTETAMYILDLLEYVNNEITDNIFNWIIKEQNEEGYINHQLDY